MMTIQQATEAVEKPVIKADVEFSLGNAQYCIRDGQFCHADGKLVVIRVKSAHVLDYLLRHNETVVSKEALASAVWPRSVASDESISKCISDIRKVLGDDAHSILETFPKRGYRINAVYGEASEKPRSVGRKPLVYSAVVLTLAVVVFTIFSENNVLTTATATVSPPDNTIELTDIERGRKALSKFTYEDNLLAERYFRTAVEQDPENAQAYAELVAAFAIRLENGWAVLTLADEERAFFYAQKAIEINPDLWLAQYAAGRLYAVVGNNLSKASEHLQRAMSLQPSSDDARVYFAVVKIFQGDQHEAIPILEAALASNPAPPFWYFLGYGHALFQAKRYEEAKVALSTCLSQMPNALYCLRFQIANYAQLGQLEDAQWAIEEYIALGHTATFSAIMSVLQEQDPENRRHFAEALKSAGLRD